MKTRSLILCAVAVTAMQTMTFAKKTEVAVRKGEVRAETKTGASSVDVGAGRKVVLAPGQKPAVSVDDPLVDDALELYKLVEAEKAHGELRIDSVLIMVARVDEDELTAAFYFEVPNPMPKATNVLTIPPSSALGDIRVYDLSGNLCRVEEKNLGGFTFSYSIHLSEQVQPGELFKLIGVTSLDDTPVFPGGEPASWKEGPLVHFMTVSTIPYALQYHRFILRESAILVDTNRQVIATDAVDGQTAVTTRTYTGPHSDALCIFAFLNPDEDGTTLADIPGKYHGLRSKLDKENSEMYQREMHKIRAGLKYTDQSTPLTALLAIFGGAMNENADLYEAVALMTQKPDEIRNSLENSKYWADQLDFLTTPKWPGNPGNGYVHPVYLCRKGSLINELVQRMVYEDGKWYSYYGNWTEPSNSEPVTSQDIAAAKAKGYLCDWEIAGPYIRRGKGIKDKNHKELFDIPFGPELPGVDVPWQSAKVEPYEQHPASVNISSALVPINQSVAYLRTVIISNEQKPARLEIFTDDGVKAWLNGEVVHENNNSRGIAEQPDAVNVTLKQGVNRLLLKVSEDIWGSRAIVRIGSDRAAGPRPADKAIHSKTQVRLGWTPAATARSHRVYLGSDQNELPLLAEVSNPQELKPLSLDADTRYYWRVDEVLADGSNIKGDEWSFATSKHVAWWTFDGHAQDRSLQAFHGALHGNPRWVPGVRNQAVALDSEEDYIIIPPMNLNTDTMTITLWVKTEEIIENPGLVFTRGGSTCAGLWFNANNNLRYNWNDDQQTWLWDSGLFVPNKTWTFAALTVDPEKATIYMHDGTAMKSATHNRGHGVARFDGVTYIGHDPRWSTVKGAIDEVRIYNYALDATEIEAIYLEADKRP
ncbi:MAG: LamG domain-containing protein [Planctomycetota bacterium]|jgi:hypothetical protein